MQKKKVMLLTSILLISTFTIILPIRNCEAELYETTVILHPINDTYVNHGETDENYGSSEKLVVRNDYGFAGSLGWRWDALIKFDIFSVIQGTQILSAKLKTYCYEQWYYNQSNLSLSIYRVTSEWDEDTATWDNQPSYTSQNTSYSVVPSAIGSWIEWSVTSDVQGFADGSLVNYGWKITDENYWEHFDIPEFVFKSKEANETDYWPCLEIELINERPVADFNYNVSVYQKMVNFIDNSTDANGTILSWFWDFGDGYGSIQQNSSHTYKNYGVYSVNLTVKDNVGGTNYSIKNVSIPIEQIIKSEIEKQFNITLDEAFYVNNLSVLIDPNGILQVERTLYLNSNPTFLISVNHSMDKLFIWNSTKNNITKVKHDFGNITSNIYENESNYYIVNISMNKSNWTYMEVNDSYVNISGLTIKRPDGSIVSDEWFWRENQNVYLIDNLSSKYQMVYYNASNEKVNLSETTTSDNNRLLLGFILIFVLIMTGLVFLLELRYKRIRTLSFYVKKGNDKINEIDRYIKNFETKY